MSELVILQLLKSFSKKISQANCSIKARLSNW